ncbi:MAG: HEAT repeat domain-containing protein [Planctomycetes bacterium]|nr:HEAT repeat domain-containing protein [Planctomycetota bacterium]MBI3847950.1 HEAT repeat domain-containing protein [Planctomycetota bacterium]
MKDPRRGRLALRLLQSLAFGGLLAVGSAFTGVAPARAWAQEGGGDELDQLAAETTRLARAGKDDEAIAKLKEFLAKEPTAEQAYKLRDRIDSGIWISLLAKGGDAENIAKRILELATGGERMHREDPAAIKAAVLELRSDDYIARRKAVSTLVNQAGPYSVPALVAALAGSPDTDVRATICYALSLLGSEGVLPLLPVLKSSDPVIVKNAITILEKSHDPRSAGALATVAEKHPDPTVQKHAREALSTIEGASGRSAHDLWLGLASRYYGASASPIKQAGMTSPIWNWTDQGLVKSEVPRELYWLRLAEDAAHEALAASPTSIDARAWLVRALVSQAHVASMVNVSLANDSNLARAMGTDAIERAIETAKADNDAVGQAGAAEALGTNEAQGLDAIKSAIAAVTASTGRGQTTDDPATTVKILIDAVDQSAVRHVLVIDPDDDARRNLVGLLTDQGFFAVGEKGGLRGLVRTKRSAPPDLVILRAEIQDITADRVVRELHDDYRTKDVPVLLVSDAKDLEKLKSMWGDKVKGVKPWPLPVTGGEVADAIRAMLGPETNPARQQADAVAVKAAEALAAISASPEARAQYPLAPEDIKRIGQMLAKKDEIRTPLLVALGGLATSRDVATSDELRRMIGDASIAAPVRAAAARSLGQIWGSSPAPEEVVQSLASALADADAAVASAAGDGLRVANLSPEKRLMVYAAHKTPADVLSGKKAEGDAKPEAGGDAPKEDADSNKN